MSKRNNIVKFHKDFHINIAFVIIFIIFIYILFHVFTYLTTENVTIYEVNQGTITFKDSYKALAIRQESIYTAAEDGNIYYFAPNKTRVGAKTLIYAIDKDGTIVNGLKNVDKSSVDVSTLDLTKLEYSLQTFVNDYNSDDYLKTYSFKTNLSNDLQQIFDESILMSNETDIQNALQNGTYFTYYAPTTGLVVYQTDGYEDVTLDNFSSDLFDNKSATINNLRNNESVLAGETVFKLITSDNWNLVMPIDDEMVETLADGSAIEIEFNEDNATTWCSYTIENRAGANYLVLSLDDSVERYADQRFISINLKLDEKNGLKIPNSAIVDKTFYTVPKKYFTRGEDSSNYGLLIQNGSNVEFKHTTIYFEDDDYYYIDGESVSDGDVCLMVNSGDKYSIGTNTGVLQGVYNVNKGYTIFKIIDIIYQNNDYTIVRVGTDYGLSLYDRIVLQGDKVVEDEIL